MTKYHQQPELLEHTIMNLQCLEGCNTSHCVLIGHQYTEMGKSTPANKIIKIHLPVIYESCCCIKYMLSVLAKYGNSMIRD